MGDRPSPWTRLHAARRLGRQAWAIGSNRMRADRFRQSLGDRGAIPEDAVVVFFATGPENFYQWEHWRRPLEHLALRRPVLVLVDRPDTGALVMRSTELPVTFARSSAELETLVTERRVRMVLYLNQVEANFRMLRFPEPVHVQIGHGESDKGGSVSNQHKAYDVVFVAGEAARMRLDRALRGFDATARTRLVGRPQLDHVYPGSPSWPRGSELRVLYAPTWEGDRPSIAYGSLPSHGRDIVESLRADAGVRIIYRPHPRTGQASAAHAAADRSVRKALAADGDRHVIDLGGDYGWQWDFADACVTDISAVAYDWLATGKPLVITEPAAARTLPEDSRLISSMPLLPADRARAATEVIRGLLHGNLDNENLIELRPYYFGDTSPGASTVRFETTVDEVAGYAADR